MREDNTSLGHYYSIALHLCITLAAVLSVMMNSIFQEKPKEHITPFDMVEPSPQPEEQAPSEQMPTIQPQENIKPIDPLELPPQPEPTPPEPTPQPQPKPEPKPSPTPKPQPKPEPVQRVSYKDFIKEHPKNVKPQQQQSRPAKPVKFDKVSASTTNLDNVKVSNVKAGTTAAMRSLLGAYVAEITRKAKGNWAIPVASKDANYSARVEFKVSKLGAISGISIIVSSGNDEFDKSIIAALRSVTLTPPPDEEPHTVYITFNIE